MSSLVPLVILGNVNVDLVLGPLVTWPAEGTEVLVPHLEWRVGGNAGNTALACAALGTGAVTVSTVGADLPGQWLRQQLPEGAVRWQPTAAPTSVTAAFTHPGSERSFVTYLGHLGELSWDTVRPLLPPARLALLAGAFLTPALRPDYPRILRELRAAGTHCALDFGWPETGFTGDVRREVGSWLPDMTYLLINELEALHLTGQPTPELALQDLSGQIRPGGVVAVKLGAQGVLAAQLGETHRVAAPSVEVIDTVGAGDTWNAAFLHALLQGAPLPLALRQAVAVASLAISTSPRRFGPIEV
ncbi:carbohydrate kinase family protein [Deinococcus sp. Leaf326]|uniref:carbohydrate kinase family protein n=1 Tax=Deinococcus sp. Leaf326 TaxID=1736338 RepID=UPI0006F7AEFC|nr:carbohydrate kinase family protein [Deinococcus sp. Leaf326]KQR23016.1 ribokinase [Deinococcus sp. Leaf326]